MSEEPDNSDDIERAREAGKKAAEAAKEVFRNELAAIENAARNGTVDEFLKSNAEKAKCRVCGRPAVWHFCDPVPGGGVPETFHLCEQHGKEHNEAAQQPPYRTE